MTRAFSSGDGSSPSPEQLREWKSLVALLMTVPTSLDAQLKQDAGLNLFEYHILVELSGAPGRSRVLSELAKRAEKTDEYAEFWSTFGPILKEGLYEDRENRAELFKAVRFRSTASPSSMTRLKIHSSTREFSP